MSVIQPERSYKFCFQKDENKKDLISDFEYGRFGMMFLFITLLSNVTERAIKGSLIWFIFLLMGIKGWEVIRINSYDKKSKRIMYFSVKNNGLTSIFWK